MRQNPGLINGYHPPGPPMTLGNMREQETTCGLTLGLIWSGRSIEIIGRGTLPDCHHLLPIAAQPQVLIKPLVGAAHRDNVREAHNAALRSAQNRRPLRCG